MASLETQQTGPAAASTVAVEKLVYGGDGLARIDGQVLLMPFVLPGEQVSVETAKGKGKLLRGKLVQVLEASPHRVIPRCEYFAICGGCHYQHSDYAFQLEQKREILRETLRRIGGLDYASDIGLISGEAWAYRNRIQLHFDGGESGFHRAGSHELCAIDHCPISSPLLVETIAKMQGAVKRREWPTFLRSVELFTNETDLQLNIVDSTRPVAARFFEWCGTFLPGLAKGAIQYTAAGFDFHISGGSFFQVNRFLIDALVSEVLGESEGDYAVDLYAGVGLFSLPLAQRFKRVEAVERAGCASRDLEGNVERAGSQVEAFKASAEEYLQGHAEGRPDLIVLDPPRMGLGPEITAELLRILPARLTIASCDPATLARDLKRLAGNYRVQRLALVDLFPQTYHFETVVHLDLK